MCAIPSGGPRFTTLANATGKLALARSSGASTAVAWRRPSHGAEASQKNDPMLPAALHPFPTDRIETVRYARPLCSFDLNDYSIPPEPSAPADLWFRYRRADSRWIIEVARHTRTYDRHHSCSILPSEAVLKMKRKAIHSTPAAVWSKLCQKAESFSMKPSRTVNRPALKRLN